MLAEFCSTLCLLILCGLSFLLLNHGLIFPWQKFVDAVNGMVLDAFQHPGEPGFGIYTVELAGLNQGKVAFKLTVAFG